MDGDDEFEEESEEIPFDNRRISISSEEEDSVEYEVLTSLEVMQHMKERIKIVNNVLQIRETEARALLNYVKWDEDILMEKFYDETEQQKLFCNAKIQKINKDPTKSSADSYESMRKITECEVCAEIQAVDNMFCLSCGHSFCLECWKGYLVTKTSSEGLCESIRCLRDGCMAIVEDYLVEKLVKDSFVIQLYHKIVLNTFVENNKHLSWCPRQGCGCIIKALAPISQPVLCRCSYLFCFLCGDWWHELISCEAVRKWKKMCADEEESFKWILKFTKACPSCHANIEKNGGCNVVCCTRCGKSFCFHCGQPISSHGRCNYFSAKQQSKETKEKLLFFISRYKNHIQSLDCEEKLRNSKKDVFSDFAKKEDVLVEFFNEAVETLIRCRITLAHTYILAYHHSQSNQSLIFQHNQSDLEKATEDLSGLLENLNAENLNTENLKELKLETSKKYQYCETRRKVLVKHVEEGREKRWWE